MGFDQKQTLPYRTKSVFPVPDTGFGLFESACGFTRKTTISPLHATEITRAVADDGRLIRLKFADEVLDHQGKTVPIGRLAQEKEPVIRQKSAVALRSLMNATIHRGTARKGIYSILKRSHLDKIKLGGKTGSLDGNEPKGRYDWFVGYGKSKANKNNGIIITVMLVHQNYVTLRANRFAALLFREWSRRLPVPDKDNT